MAELSLYERSACADLDLPKQYGTVMLDEPQLIQNISISVFKGRRGDVVNAIGALLPGPGEVLAVDGQKIIWSGLDQWLVQGPEAAAWSEQLRGLAAIADQTGGWARVHLTGQGWRDVMARICPLDLARFGAGKSARTEVGHIMALLVGLPDGIEIAVMRSFAQSLVQELSIAAASVTAQQEIVSDG